MGGDSTFHAAEAHVGIAQALYERNELDDALRHVTEGIELGRQAVEFRLPAVGLVTLAWIHRAAGDAESALDAMNEAISRTHPSPHVASLANPISAEQARLLLALGRADEAAKWTEERGLRDDDDPSYPWELDYLVLARVLLARSDPGRALGLLERLDALADSQGRRESLIQIRALRSHALHAAGDHRGALSSLAQALSIARPEGYVRVFVDEGPPMAALLRSLIYARQRGRVVRAPRAEQEHMLRVARAFGSHEGQEEAAPGVTGTGLIDPLTDREVEVLRLVAAGRTNREVARELVVTLDTVKKHVSHIFEKLGAANRTEAVVRARDVGLLS
jgi:LuxR family maltose regulon positive regulatory protein